MYNRSKQISPSEINKYMYCPYQWYYERQYGRKELRERYKERNERLGMVDVTRSNFRRGLKYHEHFLFMYWVKRVALFVLAIIILAVATYVLWCI